MTHKIINNNTPEYLAYKMTKKYKRTQGHEQINTRRTGPGKLRTMLKQIGRSNIMKLEGTGAYGPLLLAPAECLGAIWPPDMWGEFILIINEQKSRKIH